MKREPRERAVSSAASLVATVLLLSCSCASYRPQYDVDDAVERTGAQHPLRVALTPIAIAPNPAIAYGGLGNLRLDGEAFAVLVAKQLENRKVFESQRPIRNRSKSLTSEDLRELQAQGFDALLRCDVIDLQGGRGATSLEEAGQVLGSPALVALGSIPRSAYYVNSTASFKLIDTADGRTLWYETTSALAYEESSRLEPVLNQSLKEVTDRLIRGIENADLSHVHRR